MIRGRMLGGIHGPWLLCAAVLLLAVAGRRGQPPRHSTFPQAGGGERWWVGVITVGAVAARLVWGLWGPLHVNGQGPFWIRGAFEPALLVGYGPGYAELFGWLRYLGVPLDRAVFTANALLSGLSPALLYATARLTGVGRGGAFTVALALAADAVTIRTAASESYFASLILLVLAVQAALTFGVRAHLRGDNVARDLAFVAAGLLAATVTRIHPMSYLPLALCPLVVLGTASVKGWRSRLMLTAMAATVIGVCVVLTSLTTIITALSASPMAGQAIAGLAPPDYPLVLVPTALVLLLHRWMKPAWLPLLGICSLLLLLATQDAFQQSPLWKLCYQRLFLAGILLGAAPLWPRRMQGLGWASAGAAAIAVVLLAPARPYLGAQTTEQLEYRFLQEVLRDMPPGCTLAAVSRAGKRLWDIPSYLVPRRGSRGAGAQHSVETASDLSRAAATDCLLYVRSSLCSSAEARTLCESIERATPLERVASQVFAAAPSYVDLPYDRAEVEVVVFRANGTGTARASEAAVSDGAAITPQFAQALYDRVSPLRESDGCHVVQFDTGRFRIAVGLQSRAGATHMFELAATPEQSEGTRMVGHWTLAVPATLERDCGVTLATIERVLAETEAPQGPQVGGSISAPPRSVLLAMLCAIVALALFAIVTRHWRRTRSALHR